jgi:hypothetical protein
MVCWAIKNGVPFDVAHSLEEGELLAYWIVFGQLQNGNQEWDWGRMDFIERR